MQLTMTQAELQVAVKAHIANIGIIQPVGEITFSATRGPEGIITTIEVGAAAPSGVVHQGQAHLSPMTTAASAAPTEEKAEDAPEESEAADVPEGKSLFG